jgi:uncharacterized membrane protein
MLLKLQNSKQGFLGLHRLVRRLITEDGFPDRQAAIEAIADYEHFLILVVSHPSESLSPSQTVDLVWQRHMLDTRIYMQDCDRFAGKYIHRFYGSHSNSFYKKTSSSFYAFLDADVKADCLPCSCDLESENMMKLVEQVQDSLQNKNSNIPWVSQSLRLLESDPMLAINEYKRFLKLLIAGNIPLTPSKLIDEFWHQHILNSTEYFQFCTRVAGRYIHHTPHYERPHSYHRKGFKHTHFVYQKYFDKNAPQSIWSHMGESSGEPVYYFIDSLTSVAVKLTPRMVDKWHYNNIHPIFLAKGMSLNLWREFLRDIDDLPRMSMQEYIKNRINPENWGDLIIWLLLTALLALFPLGFCIGQPFCTSLIRGMGIWLFMIAFSIISLIVSFLMVWLTRSYVSPPSLQKTIASYNQRLADIGIVVTLLDYKTITIEAHL